MIKKILKTEKGNISVGAFFSYLTVIISVVLSIFYTRFILECLGEVNCSIRNIAASSVSYIGLISLGMGSSYYRFRKIREKSGDADGVKRFNGLFLIVYLLFAFIALIVGGILVLIARSGFFTVSDPTKAYLLPPVMAITVLNVALNFPLSIFSFAESYRRKFAFLNFITLIDTILLPTMTMIMLTIFKNRFSSDQLTLMVVSITLIESLVIKSIHIFYVLFRLKEKYTFKIKKEDLKTLKPIIIFSFFSFVVSSMALLHTSTDQVILSSVINTSSALVYSYAMIFHTYTNTASNTIIGLFTPRIASDAVDNNFDDIKKIFNLLSGVTTIISMAILGGFISCGREFVLLWLGVLPEQECLSIYSYAIILILCCVFTSVCNLMYNIHMGMSRHKFASILYLSTFVFNTGLSILLCYSFGIVGVIIGTLVSNLIEVVGMAIYSKKIIPHIKISIFIRHAAINFFIAWISFVITFGFFNLSVLKNISLIASMFGKGITFTSLFIVFQLLINKKFIKSFFKMLRLKK